MPIWTKSINISFNIDQSSIINCMPFNKLKCKRVEDNNAATNDIMNNCVNPITCALYRFITYNYFKTKSNFYYNLLPGKMCHLLLTPKPRHCQGTKHFENNHRLLSYITDSLPVNVYNTRVHIYIRIKCRLLQVCL